MFLVVSLCATWLFLLVFLQIVLGVIVKVFMLFIDWGLLVTFEVDCTSVISILIGNS